MTKKHLLILILTFINSLYYSQSYNTVIDTFYVQTPEYSQSIGLDSLIFPCAITTPNSGTNFPVLILVHGTAPLNMNASSTKDYLDSIGASYRKAQTNMFYEIADSLSRNGIMVFRYDKRSYTINCIETPSCWFVDTISPYDYIKDINHAINYVKHLPNVDTCNVFIAGHSQGGSFVSQVGYLRNDIRGVLNMAGIALPIDSVVINQYEFIDNDIAGANKIKLQFDSLRNGIWPMTETLYNSDLSPRFWLDWIYHTDSAIYIQKNSNKPTALMYGTADRFVPSNIHFSIWQDSITRPNVTFELFNDIDHGFGTEYDSTMSPLVLDFMSNWIHTNSLNCNSSKVEINPSSNFSVYPNPTKDFININSIQRKEAQYQITNINGKVIMSGIINNKKTQQVNMTKFKKGFYFLRIGTYTFKIVKL